MIIYPAIDLRGGQVVRLKEGDPNRQTIFSSDPLGVARNWIDQGAAWLHIVNLDGAFDQQSDNLRVLEQIATLGIPIQFGGGLRSTRTVKQAIDAGASRVVLGTAAAENPSFAAELTVTYGVERVAVALDSRDNKVAVHGWQRDTDVTPAEIGQTFASMGIRHALFTDVSQDGSLGGANLEATVTLARETGLSVIASGGITTADELRQLTAYGDLIGGAVIGMALYQGRITLAGALAAVTGEIPC
jgi:phosphoribosylformimino-5-aminoimidazole carboxamide ribotide isomerase